MNESERRQLIIESLPPLSTLAIFARLRREGMEWSDIEDRAVSLTEDIAQCGLPFAHEAERYIRRLILAGYADEMQGANN